MRIGDQKCEVATLVLDDFLPSERLRLVGQRTPVVDERIGAAQADLFGPRYTYRSICPDCRVFTRHPERPTAHPARCTYTPYVAR